MQSMESSSNSIFMEFITSKSIKVLEDRLFKPSIEDKIILLFTEDGLESSLPPDIVDSQETVLGGGVGRDDGTTPRAPFCNETCKV